MGVSCMDFPTMKKLEAGIKRVARGANSSNVVPFPIFKRWAACKRRRKQIWREKIEALKPRSEGPEAA